MKITIDKSMCIGCGSCTLLAPGSFRIGPDGKAEAIEPAGDEERVVKSAAENCPVGAIEVT